MTVPSATTPRRTLRISTGLAAQLLVLLGCTLLLLSWFVVRQTRQDLVSQVDERVSGALAGRARDTARRPAAPAAPPEARLPQGATSNSATLELPPTATAVFDEMGRQLSGSGSGLNGEADSLPMFDGRWIISHIGQFQTVGSQNGTIRFRVMSRRLPDGRVLVEAASLRLADAAVSDIIRTLIIGSFLVLAIAGFTLFFLIRRALSPLTSIARAAGVVAGGDIGHGVSIDSRYTELNQLSNALSTMVSQLGSAFDTQRRALEVEATSNQRLRQFVADASHELQTPVTSIRGWAELHRSGGTQGSDDTDRAVGNIEREALRMGRLIDNLLLLTRADEQQLLVRRPVDLASVCTDAVEAARAIDPNRRISLAVDPTFDLSVAQSLTVSGDADRLRQVVDNLLANVRVHTSAGGTSVVSVRTTDGELIVDVTDNGTGFPPDKLDHVFDRFWRADDSRSRSHGLGLAIVQSIVHSHGGTVTAANRVEVPGAVVSFRLPLTSSA
jgi:signal transduction histidine kinase